MNTVYGLKQQLLPPRATPQEIRQVRENVLGFTQSEFGKVLGVTEFSVYRWEGGTRPMTEENTRAMRALVRIKMQEVMSEGMKAAS